MFAFENDAAAKADTIRYRFRPWRNDFTTDTRTDWCVARLHGLPNQFEYGQYDSVLRQVSDKGLWLEAINF